MRSRFTRGGGLGAALVATAIACGGCSVAPAARTTVVWAEAPQAQPDYIFPLTSLKHFSVANLMQFQYLMYRPLYWYGSGGQVALNTSLSLAEAPQYSPDGKSVTITLKHYLW